MKVTPTDSNALVVIADGHYDSAAPTLWVLSEMVDRVFFRFEIYSISTKRCVYRTYIVVRKTRQLTAAEDL